MGLEDFWTIPKSNVEILPLWQGPGMENEIRSRVSMNWSLLEPELCAAEPPHECCGPLALVWQWGSVGMLRLPFNVCFSILVNRLLTAELKGGKSSENAEYWQVENCSHQNTIFSSLLSLLSVKDISFILLWQSQLQQMSTAWAAQYMNFEMFIFRIIIPRSH